VNDDRNQGLPDWKEMVNLFFREPISHLNTEGKWQDGPSMDVDGFSVFANFPHENLRAYPVAVTYCKRMLFLAALKNFKVEPGWERQLDALVQSDLKSRETIREYLKGVDGVAVTHLLTASFEGILRDNASVSEECARSFVEVASFAPAAIVGQLAARAVELLPPIKSNKKEIRTLGARAFGILAAHPSNSPATIEQQKASLVALMQPWQKAVGADLNAAEGAFVAFGHLLSRAVYYSRPDSNDLAADIPTLIPPPKELASTSLSFQDAIFDTLSQLWTAGLKVAPTGDPELIQGFVDTLFVQAKKGNERAITALGRLAIAIEAPQSSVSREKAAEEKDFVGIIISKLYELYEIKHAEVHFAVGEAITAAIACWDSDVVRLTLDVETSGIAVHVGKQPERITATLNKLLTDCKSTKPSLLKASGIWLFCIIQHCSHLPEIQSSLRECQVAFMRLLSARDELVQETASRGLALVYEKGDPSLKDELVRDLVGSFTGSGPQLKVDEDTELFDAGALPTGEGKSIT